MQSAEVQVLVVGAGVAGLALAMTLGRYGVQVVLVERRLEPSPLPRATVISTRSMEFLRSWGLEDEVLAGGVDADIFMWECETLTRAAAGRRIAVGYPTRDQAGVVSPCAPAAVPQDWLETVLRRHVGSLPAVRVELGTELVALQTTPHGVRATVRGATDDQSRTIRARYLAAADGAHSVVRRLLDIPMRGQDGALSGTQVLFHAPLWRLLGDIRYGLYWVTMPTATGLFLPAGRRDRWVYGPGPAPGGEPADLEPTRLAERIRQGAGVADLDLRIEHIGRFRSPAELADRFRIGRTFLVGDAAHRVTPRGGTGMNTALHSGHDLGWKLAWELQGWAGPELLDSYEAERRVVAEHNIIRSTDPDGSRRPVLDELSVDLGGRLTHAWLPSASGRTSTLDLLGPGWTVFTGPSRAARDAASAGSVASSAPVVVRTLDAVTARALGVHRDGAVLARPDGVPTAVWASAVEAAELRAALRPLRWTGSADVA